MTNYQGRESDLKDRINTHLSQMTGIPADYFSTLKQADIIELKTVLGDINNLLTFKLTVEAMYWLGEFFHLEKSDLAREIKKIDDASPNSKGFDIHVAEPYKIVAEVKCTVPVNNGVKFGAAQNDSILYDVKKLAHGKGRLGDTRDYFKFLFILDLGDQTAKAVRELLRITGGKSPTAQELNELRRNHAMLLHANSVLKDLDIQKVYIKTISFP